MGKKTIYLSLGSNLGSRLANLRTAIDGFVPRVAVSAESSVYETPPWGLENQPAFLNMVIKAETELEPLVLLETIKNVEVKMGRKPTRKWGPRLIDIDILYYDQLTLMQDSLVIPHPRLHERAFVLVPLDEIAKDFVHPALSQPTHSLLAKVDTKGIVKIMDKDLLSALLAEPALAWKTTVGVFGHAPDSVQAEEAADKVRNSRLAASLLTGRNQNGKIDLHPYKKWDGAHWVLSTLADLGYPPGDDSLQPLIDQSLDWLHGERHRKSIRIIDGRTRRCASQEGNALWYMLKLNPEDDRSKQLAKDLIGWQWPDGGWNCDKRPEANHSSYHETLLPLRGLALYAQLSGDAFARQAVERAAEVFLKRQLFLRQRDGTVIKEKFIQLHYPPYWHYDILAGLKVMAEAGYLPDPRCHKALDLIETKVLADGGFPADGSYSRSTQPERSGYSPVNWGGTSKRKSNPFITAEVYAVLRAAGRWSY